MLHNVLINSKWLKEFSVIPLNYNTKEVENFVKLAEQVWLVDLIGRDWYEELLDQVKDNNLTPENSTALVEAIYPYLAMCVCYEALPSLLYHVSEVSITKGHSDTSEAISLKEMTYYEQFIRRQLEARKEYCKKWICEHSDYYPLADFCACNCDCCCNKKSKLLSPNKYQQLYSTCRKNTNLR